MSSVKIFAFSKRGRDCASRIAAEYQKRGFTAEIINPAPLEESVKAHFQTGNTLLFIGAIGIAVRAIAKQIQSKTTDPAVLVVDECLRHVIPILSGHIGGANEMACNLSQWIGAVPIITTATDLHEVFAVDVFAVKNRCHVMNPEKIKTISARLLESKSVSFSTPYEVLGSLPDHVFHREEGEVGFVIDTLTPKKPYEETLWLYPRCFHVGIGARKDIPFESLHTFFLETLEEYSISIHGIASFASIDLKEKEPAILRLAEVYRIPFHTYDQKSLGHYSNLFPSSDFVKQQVGVGNVCEPAAYLSSRLGKIIVPKRARNGVTLAIAQEEPKISFDFKNIEC